MFHLIKSFIKSKGKFFFFNLIVIFILLYYTIPLFDHESVIPFIYKYSLYYLIYLTFNICIVVFYLFACIISDRNRLIFYFVIISVLTLEVAFRIIGQSSQGTMFKYPVPYTMWVNQPNSEYKIQYNGQEIVCEINNLGFRGDLPVKIKSREYSIIMIGASTVLNRESIHSKTLPGLIENHFHMENYNQIKVYNWGISAYKSEQELMTILNKAVDFQPDLILVYNGGNDIHESYNYDPRIGYPFSYWFYELGYKRMRNDLKFLDFMKLVLQQSRVLEFLHGKGNKFRFTNIDMLKKEVNFLSEAWEEKVAQNYIDNINKMYKVASAYECNIMIVLQPMLQTKKNFSEVELKFLGTKDFQNYVERMYKKIAHKFAILSENNIDQDNYKLLDIHEIFLSEANTIYKDIIHVNDYGRQIIADSIYSELKSFLINDF